MSGRVLRALGTILAGPLLVALIVLGAAGADPIRVTDIAGRVVELPAPARRIVVGSAMNLDALSIAHPEPLSIVAGWAGLAATIDPAQARALRRHYPAIDDIPIVGGGTVDTLSFESIVALEPDLVILNLYDLGGDRDPAASPLVAKAEAAGIPVAIVDFFVRPLSHSDPSLRLLGELLGTETRVEEFLHLYHAHLQRLENAFASAGADLERPSVFMHVHAAGPTCCFSPGQGVLHDLIEAAGGHNIGADALPGASGQLSIEYILSRDPDFYVATAGYGGGSQGGFTLGRDVSPEQAQDGLDRLLERGELAALGAAEQGRAYGIWHDFAQSPLHLVAIEALARWFHPALFPDLDPAATLGEINRRFLTVPLEGTFWVGPAGAHADGP